MCTRPRLGPRSFTRSANVLQALPDVRRLDDLAASIVLTPQLMEPLYAHDQNDLLIGLRLRAALVAELRHVREHQPNSPTIVMRFQRAEQLKAALSSHLHDVKKEAQRLNKTSKRELRSSQATRRTRHIRLLNSVEPTLRSHGHVMYAPPAKCLVCHDPLGMGVVLACGHAACADCMQQWTRQESGTCPFCRLAVVAVPSMEPSGRSASATHMPRPRLPLSHIP